MGYIFDALNKNNGDTPREQPAPAEVLDVQSKPEAKATGLAAIMAQADEQAPAEVAPLRLADVELSIATDHAGQTVVGTDSKLQSTQINDTSSANGPALTQDLSIDEPLQRIGSTQRVGWWSRLMGRHFRGKVDDRLVAITSPASAMSEEYRSIRTSILAKHDNQRHLVHTITSATPQEGKTITCVNLGLSFAELRNRKTIIVECDLRLPTFGKLLNCDDRRPGLIDYLRGDAKINEIIQQVEGSALHIIPAGGMVSDEAVQLLSSQAA